VKRVNGSRDSSRPTATAAGRKGGPSPGRRSLSPRVLKDIVARVVKAARPEKIILFGSAARGTMGPNSDVDLLVVKGGKFDRGKLTTAIYHDLFGAELAVDIVVVTPEEVERYCDTPCLVICPALREGKVVYGA
jgi:predicted nucleotidyltransferase